MQKLFRLTAPIALAFCLFQPAQAQLAENDIRNFQNQARACLQNRDAKGAQTAIEQSLSVAEKAFGNSEKMIEPLEFAAQAYAAMRQGPMAERQLLKVIDIRKSAHSPRDPQVALDESQLADLYTALGQYPQADNYYRQAVDILDKEASARSSSLPPILDNFAQVLRLEKKDSEAKDIEEKAQKYRSNRF